MLAAANWTWPAEIVIPLALLTAWLATGFLLETRSRQQQRSPALWRRAALLVATIISLIVALDSPIHELGEKLFWVHMTQHEILMLVSAPLLVAGVSARVFLEPLRLFGLKPASVAGFAPLRATGAALTRPSMAWSLQLVGLFVWHVPRFFDATLESDFLHACQHITFFGTAVLFWWSLAVLRRSRGDSGGAILYVFSTAVYTGFLGMLLTFSPHPWYTVYEQTAPSLGYSALQDQQLGGLIMWIPAGAILTAVALAMVPGFLRAADRRAPRWGQSAAKADGAVA